MWPIPHGAYDIEERVGQEKINGKVGASNVDSHTRANLGGSLQEKFANFQMEKLKYLNMYVTVDQ